jgi:hypothetical protein
VSCHGGCIVRAHGVVVLVVVMAMVRPAVVLVVRGHLQPRSAQQRGACSGKGNTHLYNQKELVVE